MKTERSLTHSILFVSPSIFFYQLIPSPSGGVLLSFSQHQAIEESETKHENKVIPTPSFIGSFFFEEKQ